MTRRPPDRQATAGMAELERLAQAGTRTVRELKGDQVEAWRCQATDALKFSEPLKTSNLAQYWRELRNGNFDSVPLHPSCWSAGSSWRSRAGLGLLKPLPLHGTRTETRAGRSSDFSPATWCRCGLRTRSRPRSTKRA